jgi:hypothetical protein
MRLGSCRASLTRSAAPTSENSDLLKLRLSHRKNGCGNRVWLQISNRRMCIAWPERRKSWSSIAACTSLSPTGVFRHSMILCIYRFDCGFDPQSAVY